MLKPNFINIVFYFFIKYIAFYVFMMFKNNDFTLIQLIELRGFNDWVFYLSTFLFLPIVCSIVFGIPLIYIFKKKDAIYFTALVSILVMAEYLLYTYFASQLDLTNGIYNGVLTLLFLVLFFYKGILWLFKSNNSSKTKEEK